MKAVILAGGLGTRLSEETVMRPKPMVEIGGRPILWHILKMYSQHGINDFIICCGYKGYLIKEYFANYFLHMSDVTFDLKENRMQVHQSVAEPRRVTLVDTGDNAGTGGRLKKIAHYLQHEDAFCMTYGDGVSDLDICATIAFHQSHGRQVTVTAVQPPARFGGWALMEPPSPRSRKNRAAREDGSTADFLSSSRKSSTISRETIATWRATLSNN